MKTDIKLRQKLLLLFIVIEACYVSTSWSQVIGSSVVTSVSVVLGDENRDEVQSTTRAIEAENDVDVANASAATQSTYTTTTTPITAPTLTTPTAKPEGQGVLSVIKTLKDIVEKEQEKHDQSKSSTLNIMLKRPTPTIRLPPSKTFAKKSSKGGISPSSTRLDEEDSDEHDDDDDDDNDDDQHEHEHENDDNDTEDDDDDDDDEADDFVEVTLTVPTTTPEPPQRVDNSKPSNAENDTATSAEVNEAIQKISGALHTPGNGDKNKPIENIVTDALASINDARNSTTSISSSSPSAVASPTATTNAPLTITGFTTTTRRPTQSPYPSTVSTTPSTPTTASTTPRTTAKTTSATTTMKTGVTTPVTILQKINQANAAILQQQQQQLQQQQYQQQINSGSFHQPARTGLRTTLPPVPTTAPQMTTQHVMTNMMKHKAPSASDQEIGNSRPQISATSSHSHSGGMTKLPGIHTDDNLTAETETEEDFFMDERMTTLSMQQQQQKQQQQQHQQTRVKPTKAPIMYSTVKKQNTSSSSSRPTDFYDDEIFGYDPYQTFLHGVYVPVVEMGEGDENRDVILMNDATTMRPMSEDGQYHSHNHGGFRPNLKTNSGGISGQASNSIINRKPVPSLPDHLHRPRPTHIQYQHGAAEDADKETGLLTNIRPAVEETFAVDRLQSQPRPLLPRPIVENFTNHHNEAHYGGGHGGHGAHGHGGHGGGHGHGDHGGHGHGDHGALHGHHGHGDHGSSERRPTFTPAPSGNPGLEATVTSADPEMRQFIDINNRLALRIFSSVTNPISHSSSGYQNMVLSPFTIISSLAMMFLGARGSTAQQLDGLLQLDDMLTFNPHMLYNNVTQSFLSQPNTAAALIRLLIADKSKGDILEFFKTRVQHFYDARVEEADYKFAGHLAQSIINQMTRAQIQRHSYEMLNYSLPLTGPMSLLTSAFFDGQFSSVRDQSVDSMDFIHLAALGISQSRRLISVPAVAFKDALRAAYDKDLDATAVEVPYSTRDLSLILMMPGRPGEFSIGGLAALKSRLTLDSWHGLMRGFYPRDPFKVVFPRFRHQSTLNLTYTMQKLGLTDMFSPGMAKFKGVNGLTDLFLDQNMIHFSEFGTWEKLSDTLTESTNQQNNNKNLDLIRILRPHVREHYGNYGSEPMSVNDWIFMSRNPSLTVGQRTRSASNSNPRPRSAHSASHSNHQIYPRIGTSYSKIRTSRAQQQKFKDALLSSFNPSRTMSKIYYFRQEQANNEPETVLRFERPFLYLLRHNPTGMIIMTGQYTEPVTDEQPS